MDLANSLVLAFFLFGCFLLSLGMVMQKYAVTGLTAGGAIAGTPEQRRFRLVWLGGFILINIMPLFLFVATKPLSTQGTGAAMGSNVVFTLILSAIVLKEKVTRGAAMWAVAMIASIVAANLIPQTAGSTLSLAFAFASGLVPFLFLIPVPFLSKGSGRTTAAALFGLAAGSLNGFMIIAMKLLNIAPSFGLTGLLAQWYFWGVLFFLAGLAALIFMQFAYANGPMQASAPFFYGMQVLWPVVSSYFVFASPFEPLPAAVFAFVALSAVMIQRSSTLAKA